MQLNYLYWVSFGVHINTAWLHSIVVDGDDVEAGIILLLHCLLLVSEAIGSLHLLLSDKRFIVVIDLPDNVRVL